MCLTRTVKEGLLNNFSIMNIENVVEQNRNFKEQNQIEKEEK